MSSETFELATTGRVPAWDLADRLRKSLRESELGVSEMADYLETSRNTIGNWINGHTRPRPAELKMWALRTGVDYRWLVTGSLGGSPAPATRELRDIPSGMSHDHEPALTRAEILASRKRIPLSPTDQAELILTATAPVMWRAAA